MYNSLHQTHFPYLDEHGVVAYDCDAREVSLRRRARDVNVYREVVTELGVTWSEIYRTVGVVGLTTVVAAQADAPLVGAVDPLLWSTLFLVFFIVATTSQLLSNPGALLRVIRE